ncbi:MAG TPA: tRNA (adenosine(37)-N6)-dimethylallyltransferase MiaA [Aeromicrobium sp.]|nr:tRNA (adenosine(37)-N6)-dimethylallyltransferase MiaA [Aeromicrobium sp.]
MASSDRIVAVIGPTAAGKSNLSIALAKGLGNAEIVNVDSMQVYRGMDIGTAKLPFSERRGVPHHLLDILDVTEPATVAQFQVWARAAIADCRDRRVVPIIVGGSALYIRAVLDKFEFPGTDPDIRTRWETDLATCGSEALHALLASRDPAAATQILPTNGRRIVRALEVIDLTGKPYASTLPAREYAFGDVTQIGLDVPRDVLDERIRIRVDRMWGAGLVDEVRALSKRGLVEGRTARRALGYAQVLDFLDGKCSEDEARQATVNKTRKFARRQDRWFRQDPRIHWLRYDADDLLDRAVALVHRS